MSFRWLNICPHRVKYGKFHGDQSSVYKRASLVKKCQFCGIKFLILCCIRNCFPCDLFCKVLEGTLCFFHKDVLSRINSDSCRVISAVFQFFKRSDQYRSCIFISNVSYDSTHIYYQKNHVRFFLSQQKFNLYIRYNPIKLLINKDK